MLELVFKLGFTADCVQLINYTLLFIKAAEPPTLLIFLTNFQKC